MTSPTQAAGQASEQAAQAARAARVSVQWAANAAGVAEIGQVFDRIWHTGGHSVMPDEVLRMYALTGQYMTLALDTDQASRPPVAASLGIFAAPGGRSLHSHITGVLPAGMGRAVGFALKLHQRAWALDQGIELISWTYDPLIRRNAWFNLTKLGARPARYLEDFYGSMPDVINAGDASDRLYLRWQLADPAVDAACRGAASPPPSADTLRGNGFADLVGLGADGSAVGAAGGVGDPPGLLIRTPPDAEALRRADLAASLTWRHAVRDAFRAAFDRHFVVTGFTPDGCYVLTPQEDR